MHHQLFKVLKISSKFIYEIIRKNIYINTHENIKISISKAFINHIHNRRRTEIELAERCSMFALIPDILEKGYISEERSDEEIRITYTLAKIKFACICNKNKKTANEYILISCFIEKEK